MPKTPRALWLPVFSLLILTFPLLARTATTQPTTGPALSIDFSTVGYSADGSPPPNISAILLVHPTDRDDTSLLQAAIERAASLPVRPDGFHGAILLAPGVFHIAGQILIPSAGIVLRGSPNHATTLLATGHTRRTLIEVGNKKTPTTAPSSNVTDETVPVGSRTLTLDSTRDLHPGDAVAVLRPCTPEWIADLGMKGFPGTFADLRLDWTPRSREITWDRVVTSVDPAQNQITLDAPITTALERRYGGATVSRITSKGPSLIGVEDLVLDSSFGPSDPCDEQHSWIAVAFHTVQDGWARNLTARHFAGSAVRVGPRARRITIDACQSEQPISEPAGYRRQSFLVEGQQTLVEHCKSESGMNDFAVGNCAAGPNVFLDCAAANALGPSGSFESWSSGVLYQDVRIQGAGLRLTYDMSRAQGAGWTAANSIACNCQATDFDIRGPDSAPNLLLNSTRPIYIANFVKRSDPLATSAPIDFVPPPQAVPPPALPPPPTLRIVNGRFVIGNRTLWGGAVNDAWWKGEPIPSVALDYGVSITRFVPGRDGPGLTEDLPALAERMESQGTPFYQSGPGLWYDRRRDEHSVNPRPDANVWAPFYEFPFARSGKFIAGQGVGDNIPAWDGLSRYDLTQYNVWYFERTRAFADQCAQHGIVLFHSLYNTHNVLEWGAHWIDNPWRPANNVNQTGLPEPPPLEPPYRATEPNIRVHLANQFYNVDNPQRRALHHAYIFHVLDELGSSPNVIFGVAYQFPGPLAFQQYFLDTVAEWEKQTGQSVRVELATSKDITDAILADPVRSKMISVVDLRYWQYRPDGSLWAPPGGVNLAFREAVTKQFGKEADFPPATTPGQLYRQVREYHARFPDKAIVAWNASIGPVPILLAGGAECLNRNPTAGHSQNTVDKLPLDALIQQYLASKLMSLIPRDGLLSDPDNDWCIADDANETLLIYSLQGPSVLFAKSLSGTYTGQWLDPHTGAAQPASQPITPKSEIPIQKPDSKDWLLLLLLKSQP